MPLRQGGGWTLSSAQNRAVARCCAARPLRCSALRAAGKLTARLASLRSDSPGESVNEARLRRAPASPALLRHLDIRRRQGPPATLQSPLWRAWCRRPRWLGQGRGVGRAGTGANREAPEKRRATGRAPARRASCTDSRRLFERSERSERSEFRRGPVDRASQGTRRAAPRKAERLSERPCPARPLALLHGEGTRAIGQGRLCAESRHPPYEAECDPRRPPAAPMAFDQ